MTKKPTETEIKNAAWNRIYDMMIEKTATATLLMWVLDRVDPVLRDRVILSYPAGMTQGHADKLLAGEVEPD